jgi:hypothetical protein
VIARDYEGVVAKDEASLYEAGPTRRWLKVKQKSWTVEEDRQAPSTPGAPWIIATLSCSRRLALSLRPDGLDRQGSTPRDNLAGLTQEEFASRASCTELFTWSLTIDSIVVEAAWLSRRDRTFVHASFARGDPLSGACDADAASFYRVHAPSPQRADLRQKRVVIGGDLWARHVGFENLVHCGLRGCSGVVTHARFTGVSTPESVSP